MILLVESAEYMGKHTLLCTFNNGERRKVDLTPLLKYPAFEELKDESEFERYGVDVTVFWANGADIAPEYLYENGTPFRNTCCCSRRLIKKPRSFYIRGFIVLINGHASRRYTIFRK